ncbi:AN1-type zinc finger protein 1 isoform X2 [Rhineura floridana]|uniref:AN1-type zinc finger protein 1 isoform X2 n=1 Tax=Rhineura floridana TaxID=261503 RepID=UPI002AC7FF9F|nr:AN1-type zinc finger protein 1 isoform X2 [Rhineura floridana]
MCLQVDYDLWLPYESATSKSICHEPPCSDLANLKSEVKPDHHKSFLCTYKGCDGRELVPVLCPYCEKQFCLRHRHQVDHECEKLEIPKPRMAVTQQLVKEIVGSKNEATVDKRCRGAKNSETAAKVALMKLKMHACGDKSLPQTERIYFQVFLPKESKEKSQPMFFSSNWSIGRVTDFAASLANLKNDNNKTTAKKLRLCHPVSGEALPLDHTLASWINSKESLLSNGGNVILEYLDNEVHFLENATSYLE